jgi:hypothetical protein
VSASIVTIGTAVGALYEAHRDAYESATDRLRERTREAGGTILDYDREVAPLDAEFTARSEALQGLSSSLYGAAAIVDATRSGAPPQQYAVAARHILIALERTTAVLERGSILPSLTIPPDVRQAGVAMRALAEGGYSVH